MNQNRPERKRGREKQRRDALKEAIENLQDKLLQHDETFRQEESRRRTSSTVSRASRTAKSATKGEESWSFTKVEIINQAIHTIQEVTTQNNEMQKLLLEIAKDPTQSIPLLKAAASSPSRQSAGFHQGVGPLTAVPAPVAVPQEEQVSKQHKSHDDTTATAQTNHLAGIESIATEPLWTSVSARGILLGLRKPITQESLDAREYESSAQPAPVCDDRHAHSIALPGSGAELQALLVRESLRNSQRQMAHSTLRFQAQLQLQNSMNAASAIGMPTVPQMLPAPDNSATAIRDLLACSNPTSVPFRTDGIGLVQQGSILDPNIWGRALLGGRLHQQYSTQSTDRALRQTGTASSTSLPPTNQP